MQLPAGGRHMRRIFGSSAAVAAVLLAGSSVVSGAAPVSSLDPSTLTVTELSADSTYTGAKTASSQLAMTDPSLLGQSSSDPVNVMIKYDYEPTASYEGGVAGYAPTSPHATGKSLEDNQDAVSAYESYTRERDQDISSALKAAVPDVQIGKSFSTVYGGVQATVPANEVAALLSVPGVTAVQRDSLEQPLAQDDSTTFVGAAAVWPSLGGEAHAGQGVVIGLLDTGLWPESPFFADNAGLPAPAKAHACQFGDGTDTAHLGASFTCNNKLVGAYAFTQTYMAVIGSDGHEYCNDTTKQCSVRDPEGHGTHTASTAAGDLVQHAMMYGVDRGPVSGMAPGAEIIEFRVCMAQGCFSSDSVNAVAQAIKDGVNVISFSISGGANPYTDPVELAFRDAFNAGITVSASAGNSGPTAGTTDHGGPWTITVGATTSDRFFTSTLNLTAAGSTDTFSTSGVTITNGITTPTPVVLAQSIPGEDARCQTKLTAGQATGKLVACMRGNNARVDKGFNVAAGGAAGMILYNAIKQDVETDNHWLPAIHVDGPDTALLAFINGHTGVMGTFASGTPSHTTGDVMAAFSSRGPSAFFLKPDIAAPGIQVLAGMTPAPDPTVTSNGPPGNFFQAIAGTSMSAPHVAGSAALVKATHPGWTPAEIKSALMTSSAQDVLKEDGVTKATPFDTGAGGLRVNRAVAPSLVFNESAADMVASASDPLGRVNLNLASIDATTMSGSLTTHRTAINVSGQDQRFFVTVEQPAAGTITVGRHNESISIAAGASGTFAVSISAPSAANGQYFGRITLTPSQGGNAVTIPVAFFKKQGAVTLTQSCTPTSIANDAVAHCSATVTNLAPVAANVNVSVSGHGLEFHNIAAPATHSENGVAWTGTLSPSLPPKVLSLAQGATANNGYLSLKMFGVGALAGVGDDTITNLTVPTFMYGGEPYTRIGVGSDGYLVIGGGTAADVQPTPHHLPSTSRPLNIIAPFWTDLDPTHGGAIRAAVLGNGAGTNWLVIDYDHVANFTNPTTVNTFEVWLRLGATAASEQISIEYATIGTGDPGSGINWGAQNRDGTSGIEIAPPGPPSNTSWVLKLSGPTPGGHQSITYDVSGEDAGTFTSTASMTSNVTAGITEVPVVITVTSAGGGDEGGGGDGGGGGLSD